jgi:hypothetical protein
MKFLLSLPAIGLRGISRTLLLLPWKLDSRKTTYLTFISYLFCLILLLNWIFIAHNGKSDAPVDGTGKIVWEKSTSTRANNTIFESTSRLLTVNQTSYNYKGIHYCYINVGNKTIGLQYVINNYVTTPLVMIIDDDVLIPKNIDIPGALSSLEYDINMKAIAFTIRGIDKPNVSLFFYIFILFMVIWLYGYMFI